MKSKLCFKEEDLKEKGVFFNNFPKPELVSVQEKDGKWNKETISLFHVKNMPSKERLEELLEDGIFLIDLTDGVKLEQLVSFFYLDEAEREVMSEKFVYLKRYIKSTITAAENLHQISMIYNLLPI